PRSTFRWARSIRSSTPTGQRIWPRRSGCWRRARARRRLPKAAEAGLMRSLSLQEGSPPMLANLSGLLAAPDLLCAPSCTTVFLVISYALGHGRRATLATVLGVGLGDLTSITAAMLGVGTLLAASAALFALVKWAGALYLIYIGIKLWRAPVDEATVEKTEE